MANGRKPRRTLSTEEKAEVADRYSKGDSPSEIAREFDISNGSLYRILHEYDVMERPAQTEQVEGEQVAEPTTTVERSDAEAEAETGEYWEIEFQGNATIQAESIEEAVFVAKRRYGASRITSARLVALTITGR